MKIGPSAKKAVEKTGKRMLKNFMHGSGGGGA